jgi:hypothetical protein
VDAVSTLALMTLRFRGTDRPAGPAFFNQELERHVEIAGDPLAIQHPQYLHRLKTRTLTVAQPWTRLAELTNINSF